MDDVDLLSLRFMRVWLLANNIRTDDSWTAREVAEVFDILPRPKIGFAQWCKRQGATKEKPAAPRQPTPEEAIEANTAADRQLEALIAGGKPKG
ncbi:MAG: hypothetical protein KIS92_00840 [Planctomycetota bacterium]|nr:hypothetical protein [Planctomycetota bacterium]